MSKIQWTDQTWNPTVGCSRVSAGCDHCYAITVAARQMQPAHVGLTERRDGRTDWTGEVRAMPDRLADPLRWRKPRRVFVDSMSDLFHENVADSYLAQVFGVMAQCPQHTFQVLTKRSLRMANIAARLFDPPAPNIWLGVSVEDDRYARIRTPHLLRTPAAVRFLSVEPMVGEVDLVPYLDQGIGWVIVGGESGPGARPMRLEWAKRVVADCVNAGVPVFVKQLGSVFAREYETQDRKAGDPVDWPELLQRREFPL